MTPRKGLDLALAIVAGVGIAVVTFDWFFGQYGIAQLVAFRGALAIGVGAVAVLALLSPARRHLPFLTGVVVLGALLHVGTLMARAIPTSVHTDEPGDITVLAFNTANAVPVEELAELVDDVDPQILVLTETSAATSAQLADLMEASGSGMQVFTTPSKAAGFEGTALLISTDLGTFHEVDAPDLILGGIGATNGDITIVGVHPRAPLGAQVMDDWVDEGVRSVAACGTPGLILAGDLNATVDHPTLKAADGCADAAEAAGVGWAGTWRATWPRFIGAPIDHVLMDPNSWAVSSVHILDSERSDHRPLVATLVRRGT